MKRLAITITAALAAVAVTGCGGGSATPAAATHPATTAAVPASPAKVTIRHELKGCHAWSVNGDAFAASQSAKLAVGGTMLVTDDDVMPHTLVQTGGPRAEMVDASMKHMNAASTVTFPKAGVYTFTTKAGEDYMSGVKTVGEDNTLSLTVTVA